MLNRFVAPSVLLATLIFSSLAGAQTAPPQSRVPNDQEDSRPRGFSTCRRGRLGPTNTRRHEGPEVSSRFTP